MKTWLYDGCVFFFVFLQVSVDDAASLCSLAPSPQGLTNDDEVGVQSADGVSDSHACSGNESSLLANYHIYSCDEPATASYHVRIQLPPDQLANKFDNSAFGFVTRFASLNDRGFPSVDENVSLNCHEKK